MAALRGQTSVWPGFVFFPRFLTPRMAATLIREKNQDRGPYSGKNKMKKTVPDPPLSKATTKAKSFSTCEGSHPPIFTAVAGTSAEDALVHISNLLQGIRDTAELYSQHMGEQEGRGMLWSMSHSAESAIALTEGLIDGLTV